MLIFYILNIATFSHLGPSPAPVYHLFPGSGRQLLYLSVVNHPASIHKQQHIVDSLFNIFSENIQTGRPGSKRHLKQAHNY